MIVLVVRYRAKAGKADEVEQHLKKMAEHTRQEPGCLMFLLHRSTEDPECFLLYEQYRDAAAQQAHRETAYFKEIIQGTVWPLMASREMGLYRLVE